VKLEHRGRISVERTQTKATLLGKLTSSARPDNSVSDNRLQEDIMRTVTLGVDTTEDTSARFVAAMKGEAQGAWITFTSTDLLLQMLTPRRWAILYGLIGVGPLTVSQIAGTIGRDIPSVQDDIKAMLHCGLLETRGVDGIEFPYDSVHVDFILTRSDSLAS